MVLQAGGQLPASAVLRRHRFLRTLPAVRLPQETATVRVAMAGVMPVPSVLMRTAGEVDRTAPEECRAVGITVLA